MDNTGEFLIEWEVSLSAVRLEGAPAWVQNEWRSWSCISGSWSKFSDNYYFYTYLFFYICS